jgi:transposase
MARRPISMRKAREILRLKYEVGLTNRQIARSCNLSHTTISNYLRRAKEEGMRGCVSAEADGTVPAELLRGSARYTRKPKRPLPEMSRIHRELRRKGVTLQLLWEEYRRDVPSGYGYTQFCWYYKDWKRGLEPSLRQRYKAGEKLFVDWAGQRLEVVDPTTGERHPVYLFVAALGASSYTYAEAFEDKTLASWITAHVHTYEFVDGVPEITVPDNERTGVSRACRYEPDLNPTYQEMASHYGTVVIPARAGKPKDKAKVEASVQHAERRIIAKLRNQTFFSLDELNRAIRKALKALNERPFKKMEGSRARLFEEVEKPALLPLPTQRYELAEWHKATVNIDYHVQVDWHFYSVPYQLVNRKVEVRLTVRTVEIFYRGKRVAAHRRSRVRGGFTTDPSHRPKSHQRHLEWSPGRLIRWAGTIGSHCAQAVERVLETKPHPEQGYRSSLGIMRLGRIYGHERLEAACRRAVQLNVCSYRSIKSILETKLDKQPMPQMSPTPEPSTHQNLRGERYYQ